jgi:6-phosphofructokinase
MSSVRRIAVNTGGGDAPGLNAVIRAVVLTAERLGWEVYGIKDSYDGLFEEGGVVRLDREAVRGITHLGGTILGTTNRGNPYHWPVTAPDGSTTYEDRTERVVERFEELGIDALVAIGGDGSLEIAHRLSKKGLKVVGVPKTIDNDLAATVVTFGFQTAVETATEAIGKLHSTAESHERVMVVELMGRNTGWISLYAGVAGTADVVLIPEIPYDIESVCRKVEERYLEGREFAIVVVSEGTFPVGGEPVFQQSTTGPRRLERGGGPNAWDRLLALRFGSAAVKLVAEGQFGTMVALAPPKVLAVPLEEAISRIKRVPLDSDVIATARSLGICLGD